MSEREERKNQKRRSVVKKKQNPSLCKTPSFASSSHSNSLRDDDDEKKTEIIKSIQAKSLAAVRNCYCTAAGHWPRDDNTAVGGGGPGEMERRAGGWGTKQTHDACMCKLQNFMKGSYTIPYCT